MSSIEFQATWLEDVNGKEDYDGRIVRASCRYYPPHKSQDNKPSAYANILMGDHYVARIEVTGETEAEVKGKVEQWVQDQHDRITAALSKVYKQPWSTDF